MLGNHNVVITPAGADGEAAYVVDLELADELNLDKEFAGLNSGELTGDFGKRGVEQRLGLGGSNAFPDLGQMTSD